MTCPERGHEVLSLVVTKIKEYRQFVVAEGMTLYGRECNEHLRGNGRRDCNTELGPQRQRNLCSGDAEVTDSPYQDTLASAEVESFNGIDFSDNVHNSVRGE